MTEYIINFLIGFLIGLIVMFLAVNLGAKNHSMVHQDIEQHLYSIKENDRINPLCNWYQDEAGNEHGCLTDVQQYEIEQIHKLLRDK